MNDETRHVLAEASVALRRAVEWLNNLRSEVSDTTLINRMPNGAIGRNAMLTIAEKIDRITEDP